ncbi:MAG TPA: hypothetical protein VKD66_10330 [Streptosporangiaceae bacterium]|nr:hypothetical protein [Streptosporangiaceae bacterium]
MAAEQGKDTTAGQVPALNIERVGIWTENQLDRDVWQVIDQRTAAPAQTGP